MTNQNIVDASVVTAVQTAVGRQTDRVNGAIRSLTIASNDDYRRADLLLVEIRQARKTAEEIFAEKIRVPILEPTRKALDGLYALERELTKTPFETAEKGVKAKMAAWQDAERKRIAAEQEAARREEMRRQREAEQAASQAEQAARAARTIEQRRAAEEALKEAERRRQEAEAARQAAIEAERQKTVKGVGSKVTVVRKPVVTDMMAFLKAVVAGTVPLIAVQVNEDVVDAYWRDDAGLVSAWPGVTIEESVKIGGR